MATFSAPAAKEHVKGLRAQIVHRADQEFPFLHDTMIVPLGGRLLMAWYNCSENEIVGRRIGQEYKMIRFRCIQLRQNLKIERIGKFDDVSLFRCCANPECSFASRGSCCLEHKIAA